MRPLRVDAEPAFRTAHANPYNARLYRTMQQHGVTVRDLSYLRLLVAPPDIVHLHWPQLTFLSAQRSWRTVARLIFFFGFLRIARLRGTRLLWTVHNVTAHEERSTPRLRAIYRRLLFSNLDGFLALTAEGVTAAREAYPLLRELPAFVTPHGHYRDDYDLAQDRASARAELGIDAAKPLVVAPGQVRSYKNLPALISSFRRIDGLDALLAIAGKPASSELADELHAAAAGDQRVRLELDFVPDDRLAAWLRAADLVVLPYSRIQNSGTALLALSADRPVVVPAIGAMTELARSVGDEWVYTYRGEFTPAVLRDALRWAMEAPRAAHPNLSEFDWDAIAASTEAAYRSVLGPRHTTHAGVTPKL